MENNIVERLRAHGSKTEMEAADLIERLQLAVRIERKRMAARDQEIARLEAEKKAISQTASDYLHEIEELRVRLANADMPET
jgi:hypothetical protein